LGSGDVTSFGKHADQRIERCFVWFQSFIAHNRIPIINVDGKTSLRTSVDERAEAQGRGLDARSIHAIKPGGSRRATVRVGVEETVEGALVSGEPRFGHAVEPENRVLGVLSHRT